MIDPVVLLILSLASVIGLAVTFEYLTRKIWAFLNDLFNNL